MNSSIKYYIMVLSIILNYNAVDIFATSFESSVAQGHDVADSAEVYTFKILEPVISGPVPDSLKRICNISDETSVSIATMAETTGATEYAVGQIPFSSSITPSGGRIYSLPIPVAAGWSAVPSVSLCYNSQSGNGVAGYGWSISGLSLIELRNKNYYYDGKYQHSEYDAADNVYSLDGVPIVPSSAGLGDYDYSTSRGNILIKKHRISSGVVSHFTVLYPDGRKGTFGYPTNTNAQVSYPLTRIEDINGNMIDFNYSLWCNHYYIQSITYGNDAMISFQYSSRNDNGHTQYRAGQSVNYPYNNRISSIISIDGETEICRYTLTYEYKDDISLLRQIDYVSDGSAYNPVRFTYGVDSQDEQEEFFELEGQSYLQKYFVQEDGVNIIYKRGRFTPGGYCNGIIMLPEFSIYDKIASKYHLASLKRYYKYGSKYNKDQIILCKLNNDGDDTSPFELKAGEGFQTIDAVDVDGDGTDELVKINNKSIVQDKTDFTVYVYSFDRYGSASCDSLTFRINDGTHNPVYDNPAKCYYYYGDFRGNGRQMLMVVSRDQSRFVLVDLYSKNKVSESSLFTMSDEAAGLIFPIDFENDGQDDLCQVTDNGMDVYSLPNINGTTFTKRKTYSGISKSLLYYEPTYKKYDGLPVEVPGKAYVLDINGDGYNDIAYAPDIRLELEDVTLSSPTWNISIFNGKSFSTQYKQLYTRQEDDEIVFLDVDKDGLPDMLHFQNSRLYLIPNVKGSFQKQYTYTNVATEENAELIPLDAAVYGIQADILTISGPIVNVYEFSINHSTNRLLYKLTDSFGINHYDIYRNIARNTGAYQTDHARSYDASSGYVRQRIPLYVLYNSHAEHGETQITDEYYTYYDAVLNNRGIGFCGFGRIRHVDSVNGYETLSEFDPEKMGVMTRCSKSLQSSSNSPFEVTVNTYDNHSTTYGKLNPRLTKSVTTNAVSGINVTNETTYDIYDYPTLITSTKEAGDGMTHTEKISRTYKHSVSEEIYLLGTIEEQYIIKNSSKLFDNLSWKERYVMTHDNRCRPLTRKDYVGDYGFVADSLLPWLPEKDSLIRNFTNQPSADRDRLLKDSLLLKPIDTALIQLPGTSHDATNLVAETQWEYDSYGNVISEKKAPYGATTFTGSTYAYDETGRYLVSSTDPLGHTTTYAGYNKFGKPTNVTDHRGRTTVYTYDEWGNLIKTEHPDGTIEETIMDWGGQGLFTVTSTASGNPTVITHYDALGREIRTGTQRYNSQWQYVDKIYDSKGRLQKESLPFRGASASYWNEIAYDDYNRKTRLTEASGKYSIWSYTGTSVSSFQNGIQSTRTYDANGNLISVTDPGGTIAYTLRDDGQPSEVVAPGNVKTIFSYDEYGRRKQIVDPSAGMQTENVVYNSDGSSVTTHTNPNGSIITHKDRYGRTTRVERPGEYNTDYVYDSNGLLTSEVSSNGTSKSYVYDSYDRVSSITETVPDGKWLKKTYVYTSGSNVSSISYESQSGAIGTETFSYSYGNIVRIGLMQHHIRLITGENDFGQPTSVTTGNITRTYSYTPYGMPTRRTMGSVMDYSYSFDPLKGNLMSRTDNLRNQTETFGYDALNRLTVIDDREITYSDNGNITSIDSVGDMTYDNSAKPYQVTSLTLEDNVVPSRVQNITYTCYSRPSIMEEGGRSAAFTYNGDGARVKMNVSDGATAVLSRYYIGNQYELDVTPNGTTERLYLGGDAYSAPAVYVKEGSGAWTFYNIGRDYLGNITHIATSDGTLVEENSYDPWGRLRNPETKEIYSLGTEPELMLGRGYSGHEHLTWFGLINMNARLYDPLLGRFLSPDPFVQMPNFTQNFNRYSYCLNNPLVYVDENGEFWHIVIGAVIGGVSNWISNGCEFSWRGLGYFGVGTGIGALSAITGGVLAGITQAAGVFAGASIGILTGAATGGASSFLLNGGNNLLQGKSFISNWQNSLISGAISGAIGGAISGGVRGYKYAKDNGANPWNRNYMDDSDSGSHPQHKPITKEATSVKQAVSQPDPSKHCYAYAAEYADQGHGNRPASYFLELAKNVDGANPMEVMNKANSTNGSLYGFREDQLISLGAQLTKNFEVISVTNNHVVNLRGITYGYKLKMFFGGIGNKLHLFSAYVHDPNKGYTVTSYLQTVGIIKY